MVARQLTRPQALKTRNPFIWLVGGFWLIAISTLLIIGRTERPSPGWDTTAYSTAMVALQKGTNPYHSVYTSERNETAKAWPYVYSPMSLPLLKAIAAIPVSILRPVYTVIYGVSMVAVPLLLLTLADPGAERNVFALLSPACLFFPGLLLDYVAFSGNLAYILYALIAATTCVGVMQGQWLWFYIAVLCASVFKAPMLSILVLPLLYRRRSLPPVVLALTIGVCLIAVQPLLWPVEWQRYIQAVKSLFIRDADFGVSPAGLLGTWLTDRHLSYTLWTVLCFLAYASIVIAVLWDLRARYLTGIVSLRTAAPTFFLGVLLLDPRIKEYDLAALTLPMALIIWRLFRRSARPLVAFFMMATLLIAIGFLPEVADMKFSHGIVPIAIFVAGALNSSFFTGTECSGRNLQPVKG